MLSPKKNPWELSNYKECHIYAIKALAAGNANSDQQKMALQWIIETACATYDMSFRPDSERATCFAEGRRAVGNEIIRLIKLMPKKESK